MNSLQRIHRFVKVVFWNCNLNSNSIQIKFYDFAVFFCFSYLALLRRSVPNTDLFYLELPFRTTSWNCGLCSTSWCPVFWVLNGNLRRSLEDRFCKVVMRKALPKSKKLVSQCLHHEKTCINATIKSLGQDDKFVQS